MRLFHWLAVVLVAAAYVTLKLNWIAWHVRIGEALLALGIGIAVALLAVYLWEGRAS